MSIYIWKTSQKSCLSLLAIQYYWSSKTEIPQLVVNNAFCYLVEESHFPSSKKKKKSGKKVVEGVLILAWETSDGGMREIEINDIV